MPISRIKSNAINDGAITIAKTNNLFVNTEITGTEAARMPVGTTAQRANAQVGDLRHNSTLGILEQYTPDGWQGIASSPTVTSISPTNINESDSTQTIVITGQSFDAGATALLVGSGGNINPTTSTRNSSSQITIVYSGSDAITTDTGPYDVKVTNSTGLAGTLDDALTLDDAPNWSTAAGSLGTVIEDIAMSTLTVAATDPEGASVTYSVTSGALPSGTSLGSSNGQITGTPNVGNSGYSSSGVTHNFTVTANDGTGNTTPRAFSILRKWQDGSTSAQAVSSLVAFDAISTGDTGYNTRYVSFNGAVTPFQMDTYTDSSNVTWYVTSPTFGTGGINVLNNSIFGQTSTEAEGTFKTIVGSQVRTVSMGGNFSAFSSKTPYNIFSTNTPSTYVDTVTNINGNGYAGGTQTSICGKFRGDGHDVRTANSRLGYNTLNWYLHGTGGNANSTNIAAMRAVVTQLSILTPWTAVTGDDDGTNGAGAYSAYNNNNDYTLGSTPAGTWLKDTSNNAQKMISGVTNANENMFVSMWTHNDHSHKASSGSTIWSYTGGVGNGLSTTGMVLAAQYDSRVGSSSTVTFGPAYSSATGFRNSRLPYLVR
jgi:hypothetical protein